MIQWRKKHHSFHLENVWYVIHDRKSDVEHRTCIYFIPSWKSNLSSIIFKKFSFESNVHFHYPNSAQAVQRLSSELHDQDQAGRYCQQSAFGRKPAVSFESGFELPPQAAVRGKANSSRRYADFFVVFLLQSASLPLEAYSSRILRIVGVHFVFEITRRYCLGQAAWMLPAFKLFFNYFAEPSAKNFRSQVHFLPALFRLMM